jgi:hypothetical protein
MYRPHLQRQFIASAHVAIFLTSHDAGVRREARTLLWVCETSFTEQSLASQDAQAALGLHSSLYSIRSPRTPLLPSDG